MIDTTVRTEFNFSLSTEELGKRNCKVLNKIMVTDLVIHLAKREMYKVIAGVDEGVEIPRTFKNPLVLDDFMVR